MNGNLHPWLILKDAHGQIICTVPLRESNMWNFVMVYGSVVICRFLEDAVHPNKRDGRGYEDIMDRSIELDIDMRTASAGMN